MLKLKLKIFSLFVLLLVLLLQGGVGTWRDAQPQIDQSEQANRYMEGLSPYFVENIGQLNEAVKYHLKMKGTVVYLTPHEVVYQFMNRRKEATSEEERFSLKESGKAFDEVRVENVRVKYLGVNEGVKVEGLNERKTKINYFIGDEEEKWIQGARAFSDVIYKNLYSGIDMIVSGNQDKIKYTYVVGEGADAKKIAMKHMGVEGIRINESGELEMDLEGGHLFEEKPYCYQIVEGQKIEVESSYAIAEDGTVKFEVGDYNKEKKLIIDPGLVYSSYLGGISIDRGYGIAVDEIGNVYVTGETLSSNFPTTSGAFDYSHNSANDAFVALLSPLGNGLYDLLYCTFLGGSGHDRGEGIAVGANWRIYVTGSTYSSNFPTTSGAFDTTYNDVCDAFVVKLRAYGAGSSDLLYSSFLGGGGWESGFDVAVDGSGNIYIGGHSWSGDFPTTSGAYDTTFNGEYDAFVTKLSPSGNGAADLLYSTFLGGALGDSVLGIKVSTSGHTYITGSTSSSLFPTTSGAYATSFIGGTDAFIAKLSLSGGGTSDLLYSTFLGGNSVESGYGIDIDASGDIYVAGPTESTNFPTTSGSYSPSWNGGGYDVFAVKLRPSGNGSLIRKYQKTIDNISLCILYIV